jgi:phosphate transport system substrate-binding protein
MNFANVRGTSWIAMGIAALLGCAAATAQKAQVAGTVKLDGSSTVSPISAAAAEMFKVSHREIRVTVGTSGTGGGFKKFLESTPELRTDINNASRPIKQSEIDRAKELGVEFIEIPIAYDGIAIVVHPANSWCDYLTVEELKRIWEPGSTINNWKAIRPGFPDKPLKLYGPGTDSGTFDYFTEAINGKEDACRSDYTASENDNVLVQGVKGDAGSLGYFGFAYYEANKSALKLVGVQDAAGKPILPTTETIRDGTYRPLARPLFIYVNRASAERPEVAAFVQFYLENGRKIVEHPRVKYVGLPDELYKIALERFHTRVAGSMFGGKEHDGRPLLDVYKK